jgi:AcrR family transcriptional regulator
MRTRATRAERVEQNSARLMDAARKVFARRGYHAATLDEVAAAAGFTKGAVYARFASKAELMLALLAERIARREAEIRAASDAVSRSPAGVASALARQWADASRRDRDWTLLVYEFRVHAARDRALNACYRALHARLRSAIAEAFASVAKPTRMSVDDLARIAMAMSNGFALERCVEGDAFPDSLYERSAVALAEGLTS